MSRAPVSVATLKNEVILFEACEGCAVSDEFSRHFEQLNCTYRKLFLDSMICFGKIGNR